MSPFPHPNSNLTEYGILNWPKSDRSDFGWLTAPANIRTV